MVTVPRRRLLRWAARLPLVSLLRPLPRAAMAAEGLPDADALTDLGRCLFPLADFDRPAVLDRFIAVLETVLGDFDAVPYLLDRFAARRQQLVADGQAPLAATEHALRGLQAHRPVSQLTAAFLEAVYARAAREDVFLVAVFPQGVITHGQLDPTWNSYHLPPA